MAQYLPKKNYIARTVETGEICLRSIISMMNLFVTILSVLIKCI